MHSLTVPMTRTEAADLVARTNRAGDTLCDLLQEAKDREAWKALDYPSWREFAAAEYTMSRSRSYQLLGQAKVRAAITSASGSTKVDITERAARDIAPRLPEVEAEIRERVQAGEDADTVVPEVVDKHRQSTVVDTAESEEDDFSHSMVEELERCEKECEALRRTVESLSKSDLGSEVTNLHERVGRLEGLLAQRDTTTKAATDTLNSQNRLLDRIQKVLGVANRGAILEALADLLR